nr:GrpB family protein [uncultured Capnocytophaga sp.]
MTNDEQTNPLLRMSLAELWELFPIILSPFNPLWKEWYEEEKSFLQQRLPSDKVLRISHIGSTAIGEIWTKSIIDILVELDLTASLSQAKEMLLQAGYLCMNESPTRISFNKGYTLQGFSDKVFHLHLRYWGDNDELYFRDYLQEHLLVARQYEALKISLWKPYEHDRDAYTAHKTSFITKYTQIAKEVYKGRYQ